MKPDFDLLDKKHRKWDEFILNAYLGLIIILLPLAHWTFQTLSVLQSFNYIAVYFILIVTFFFSLFHRHIPGDAKTQTYFLSWYPLLLTYACYLIMAHLDISIISRWLGVGQQDILMASLDTTLFGQILPLYFERLMHPWLTEFFKGAYIYVYIFAPALLLLWVNFIKKDFKLFYKIRMGFIFIFVGGYLSYLLIPVTGPLAYFPELFQNTINYQEDFIQKLYVKGRYAYDCFPSIHTALPWFVTLVSYKHLRLFWKCVSVSATLAITLSTLYLRYHYGVDVIMGILWAIIVNVLVSAYWKNRQIILHFKPSN